MFCQKRQFETGEAGATVRPMKAIVFDRIGSPEKVLELREVPAPQIGPGEVLVRMVSASINPGDSLFIIKSGQIELFIKDTTGQKIVLHTAETGDMFGELAMLDSGMQITPPDLNGAAVRIFVPRSALSEVTVLGVVGVARRKPLTAAIPAQPKLFSE